MATATKNRVEGNGKATKPKTKMQSKTIENEFSPVIEAYREVEKQEAA